MEVPKLRGGGYSPCPDYRHALIRSGFRLFLVCGAFALLVLAAFAAVPAYADAGADALQAARDLYQQGAHDQALAASLQVANDYPPLAPDAVRLVADCYYGKKDRAHAAETLQGLIADYPESQAAGLETRRALAVWYSEMEAYDDCRAALASITAQYPDERAWAENFAAVGYRAQKNYPEAFEALQRALNAASLPRDAGLVKDIKRC